jgi:hypothetical protein
LMNCEGFYFGRKIQPICASKWACAQVAKRELKNCTTSGNVMFILNSPKNEKAEPLKCYVSNCSKKYHERKTYWFTPGINSPFQSIYETTTKPKNDSFIKVIIQLQKHRTL